MKVDLTGAWDTVFLETSAWASKMESESPELETMRSPNLFPSFPHELPVTPASLVGELRA